MTMPGGGPDTFYVLVHDAAGERLLGVGAVQYTVSANLVITDPPNTELSLESVSVAARELGPGLLEAEAGDASQILEIEVVDASVVAQIQWENRGGDGWWPSGDDAQAVRAFTADGREVHHPECEWTLDPPDHPAVETGRSSVSRSTEEPVGVTCTIGVVSATTSI